MRARVAMGWIEAAEPEPEAEPESRARSRGRGRSRRRGRGRRRGRSRRAKRSGVERSAESDAARARIEPAERTAAPASADDPRRGRPRAPRHRHRRGDGRGAADPLRGRARTASVVPDLARKLPGRGLWVAADRASVETAAKKGLFARAAKAKLAAPRRPRRPGGSACCKRRLLAGLGLARRAGDLTSGFEKVSRGHRRGQGRLADRGVRRRRGRPPQAAGPRPASVPAAADLRRLHADGIGFGLGRWRM